MFKYLFSAIFCLLLSSFIPPVQAQDDVTESLKKRLQESLQASASPASTPNNLRAYLGVIKDMIGTTIVIDHKDGKKDIKIEEDTVILRSPGNTTIKASNINIGDSIIGIGTPINDEILSGKRLIVSSSSITTPSKVTAMGVIKSIAKSAILLTINDQDQKIFTTSKTVYKSPAGSIESTDLTVGDTVIYTATTDDDDHTATIVMRIKTAPISE